MYTKQFKMDIHDIDYRGISKVSALMRLMQSAAESQLSEVGLSYDNLKRDSKAFILSRITLKIYKDTTIEDELVASTYPTHSRGFTFMRCFGIEKDGEPVCAATSAWALIDTESRSLIRVDNFDLPLDIHPAIDCLLGRFILPKDMDEVGRYTVGYGDIDRNRHMNNTVYPDAYLTFLPLAKKRISELTISYRSEAVMGDVLSVFMKEIDGVYYFKTVKSDGTVNTEAEIRLSDS